MNTNTNSKTLTGLAGAEAMVDCFAETCAKVMAGRNCELDEAASLVLAEVAKADADTFARLLRSLERVRQARA
jgi:hypothetical protein